MKKFFLFFFIAVFSLNVFAQNPPSAGFDLSDYGVRIEPDKRLMVVLASLEAAGMETPLSEKGTEFRQKLQADLGDLNPELRQRMKQFVIQYKKRNPNDRPAELLAPFISMAYSLTPVPDLGEPSRTTDLPGSLLEVLDFAPLVREFYRRSRFSGKLDTYVKDYQKAGDEMRGSSVEMVQRILDYLHTRPQISYIEKVKTEAQPAKSKKTALQNTEIRERERRFYIVPEMLAPRNTVNFRNIGDDYYAIVPPATDLSGSETRRAFLQFVFDPLVLKNAKEISGFREGIKALLDERRKENPNISPDVFLAVSRSLVAAADAKETEYRKTQIATAQARRRIDQMKTDDEKRKISAELQKYKQTLADETVLMLSEAYQNGAVLSFYFARQLNGLSESGFDIAGSLRDMILSLDAAKEANRLTEFAEARNRAEKARAENAKTVEVILENPITKRLLAIDEIIKTKNYEEAEKQLEQLLNENPKETRIHYTLGRVASLSAEGVADSAEQRSRLLKAKGFYENVIKNATPATDKALLSLSYTALGRIYEFYDEAEYAIKIYETAIKYGDVSGGAYKEAVAARERLLKEQ
jgi:hypothetical protein